MGENHPLADRIALTLGVPVIQEVAQNTEATVIIYNPVIRFQLIFGLSYLTPKFLADVLHVRRSELFVFVPDV